MPRGQWSVLGVRDAHTDDAWTPNIIGATFVFEYWGELGEGVVWKGGVSPLPSQLGGLRDGSKPPAVFQGGALAADEF